MKRISQFALLLIASCVLPIAAFSQNWTTVSASNITDLNQQKLAAGSLCFLVTDLNDNPISVMIGGGGQSLQRPYCSTVTNGSVASFTVPNPASTSPANIAYRVTGTDSSTGQVVLRYKGVQFTGATFNFDTYVPGFNMPLGASANVLSVGNLTITGSCSGCATGSGYSLIQQAGTNLAQRLTLNFVSGVTCSDNAGQSRTDCAVSGVTSVGLALPGIFSVSGSPVTSSGTLTGALAPENANTVFVGPTSGGAATPTFRTLVSADIPNNSANTTGTAGSITGSLALGNTPLTTLGDILYVNSTPALARLAGQTSTSKEYLSQTGTGTLSAAPAWAQINFADISGTVANSQLASSYSGVGACASHQWSSTLNANAAPTCTQPAYTDISGTPTLYYQTLQNASGTAMAQEPKVEFTGTAVSSVTDDSANNRTVVTLTASAGSGLTLQTGGTNNSSQSTLNFQNGSTVNGIQVQPSNPSGGNEQMAISGTLTVPGGGTGLGTLTAHELYVGNGSGNPNPVATGNAGQVLISNGASSDPTFQDPIVSYNYSTLLNAALATATQNGTARVSKLSAYGTVYVTFAALSGTYTGCTVQLANVDNLGNAINDGSAISITPANGTTSYEITPAAGLKTTDQIKATWACGAYGSAGTITAVYSPGDAVGIIGTPAVAESGTWTVQPGNTANTTPWLATINQGGNSATVTASNALKVDGSAVTQPVSGTMTANEGGTWTVQPGNTANTTPWLVQGNLSNNGAAVATNRLGVMNGIAQTDYNNGTAATQGRDVADNVGTDGLLWVAQLPAMRPASFHANANFAASSTTDNAVLPGNASNTVLVTKVTVSCTQTTAGIVLMKIIKRSTADSAGTSAAMTAVPDDSNYSAAVSAPLSYTGTGPTVGTAVGNIDTYYLGCLAPGTATPNDIYVLNLRQKPIVLRGTAQQLAVNFNNAALTGGNLNVTFEWIETKTITP